MISFTIHCNWIKDVQKQIILIFPFFFKGVTGIKCYQCSSADDPDGEDNCGAYEPFYKERHVATDCNSEESHSPGTFCVKITQQGPRGFICKLNLNYIEMGFS